MANEVVMYCGKCRGRIYNNDAVLAYDACRCSPFKSEEVVPSQAIGLIAENRALKEKVLSLEYAKGVLEREKLELTKEILKLQAEKEIKAKEIEGKNRFQLLEIDED